MKNQIVTVLRWPEEEHRRASLAATGSPRLLLLTNDSAPPTDVDDLEDWLRDPVDLAELDARCAVLLDRARQSSGAVGLDEDERVVWSDTRSVHVSEAQAPIARLLIENRGSVVSREAVTEACRAVDGSADPRAVKSLVGRLARRLSTIGLTVHTVRGRGWLLADAALVAPADDAGVAFAVSSFMRNKSETHAEAPSSQRVAI